MWDLIWRLVVASFLVLVLFFFVVTPVIAVLALGVTSRGRKLTFLAYPSAVLMFLVQMYFWVGWAAYCSALTVVLASDPTVSEHWPYYVIGFFFLNAPIAYLAAKELGSAQSHVEASRTLKGTALYNTAVRGAFIVFCLYPPVMAIPYGSLLERLITFDDVTVRGLLLSRFPPPGDWSDAVILSVLGGLLLSEAIRRHRARSTSPSDELMRGAQE